MVRFIINWLFMVKSLMIKQLTSQIVACMMSDRNLCQPSFTNIGKIIMRQLYIVHPITTIFIGRSHFSDDSKVRSSPQIWANEFVRTPKLPPSSPSSPQPTIPINSTLQFDTPGLCGPRKPQNGAPCVTTQHTPCSKRPVGPAISSQLKQTAAACCCCCYFPTTGPEESIRKPQMNVHSECPSLSIWLHPPLVMRI